MKKILIIMMIAIAASSMALGQIKTPKSNNNSVEAQLIALEKQAWEAQKNRNGSFFQSFLSEDSIAVSATGVENKAQIIKFMSGSSCELKSYSLDNFKLVMLEKNTAILTYKLMQDAICNGKALPATVWVSSLYVKRGGKWLGAFYQETPAIEAQ